MTDTFSRRDIIRGARGVILAGPFISLAACDEPEARKPHVLRGATMGTTYSVTMPRHGAPVDPATLQADIDALLETVNEQMSTYRPDSELSLFNAAAETAGPVSAETRRVVRHALGIGDLTGGAFDPTIGPLVNLWGFGPDGTRKVPPGRRDIADAFAQVGYRNISAPDDGAALVKQRPGVRLDLSGIAKGHGVDAVAGLLEDAGVTYYLVEIGGEVRTRGYSPRGDVWRVGIERPDGNARRHIVGLGGKALATSGNYRNFFESEGRRYPHIIDPRTGRPVEHGLASVTVIADTAMQADALSTALMVLGPEEGFRLAQQHGIAAFFLDKGKRGLRESATQPFLRHLLS